MAVKVFIDQGHNPSGHNTGATGYGIREQDVTYEVGVYLAELLEADGRFAVRLSRNSPDQILGTSNATSLKERVDRANAWPADYFISIHANANLNENVHGSECYVYKAYTDAYYLAGDILKGMVAAAGTKDNGVRVDPGLYVLRKTTMPAVLVELAYVSNDDDAALLKSRGRDFAEGIYQGILSYLGLE